MSHLKERVEKNCLNCNAQVKGKYCHICGQENILPKESISHLLNHYFQDITHFDGKFFSSIKLLIFRPGFLSLQYVAGRRSAYLNPIRMYVFTSAIFFLIFFSFVQKDIEVTIDSQATSNNFIDKLETNKVSIENELAKQKDTLKIKEQKNRVQELNKAIEVLKNASLETDSFNPKNNSNSKLTILSNIYSSTKKYDSIQQKIPADQRDGWLAQKINYKSIEIKNKYKNDLNKIVTAILQKFKHSFPQLLFLSLPFFALLLKLLYIRQKQLFYVDHIIFTIHLYCAVFILLLIIFGFNGLETWFHWSLFTWLATIFTVAIIYYQYKALRNFYQQTKGKTLFKFLILNISMVFIFIILTAIMFIFSAYQI